MLKTDDQWTAIDGTLWSMTHGKHWAEIELSLDNTMYFATVRKSQDEHDFVWDNDCWDGDFDCLEKAKAACIQAIQNFINPE